MIPLPMKPSKHLTLTSDAVHLEEPLNFCDRNCCQKSWDALGRSDPPRDLRLPEAIGEMVARISDLEIQNNGLAEQAIRDRREAGEFRSRAKELEARIRDLEANIRESNAARATDAQHIADLSLVIEAHTAALEEIASEPGSIGAVARRTLTHHHPSQARSRYAEPWHPLALEA